MSSPRPEAPRWLRAVQVFEYAFILVGALLVVTGLAPRLGVGVAVVAVLVAVLTSMRVAALRGDG